MESSLCANERINDSLESQVEVHSGNQSERPNSPVTLLVEEKTPWHNPELSETLRENRLGVMQRYRGSIIGALVISCAVLSPILMILWHKLGLTSAHAFTPIVPDCGTECHALLLTLMVKLVVLIGGIWCIFWRLPLATLPRLHIFRTTTLLLTFFAVFTFWLFYWVRAEEHLSLLGAIAFAGGLTDALLAIHYFAVLLIHIRHIQPQFHISILRSPDGVQKNCVTGPLSIQRTAVWVLQNYYTHFPVYNPHMERRQPIRKQSLPEDESVSLFRTFEDESLFSVVGRQSGRSRATPKNNDRFQEELDLERVRKRRGRLIAAAEEAFTQVRRIQEDKGGAHALDSSETAAVIFPSLARPLQKYLRCCREQPWHSSESVLKHLATCLRLGLSSRAFLQKFLSPPSALQAEPGNLVSWGLVSEVSVSSGIRHGTEFLLRGDDVSLFVRITQLPHFNLLEEVTDPKNNQFSLHLSSETSV